jgi:uncharacterized protein YbjQ (UPF0145 family)
MFLSTSDTYDTSKYVAAGVVNANHVEAISVLRGFGASIAGLFGSKSNLLTKKLSDAYAGALDSLQKDVAARMPNAVGIVGIRTEMTELAELGFLALMVVGTVIVPVQRGGRKSRKHRQR